MKTVRAAGDDARAPEYHYADDKATLTWCGREIAWTAVSAATVVDCRYCADRAASR